MAKRVKWSSLSACRKHRRQVLCSMTASYNIRHRNCRLNASKHIFTSRIRSMSLGLFCSHGVLHFPSVFGDLVKIGKVKDSFKASSWSSSSLCAHRQTRSHVLHIQCASECSCKQQLGQLEATGKLAKNCKHLITALLQDKWVQLGLGDDQHICTKGPCCTLKIRIPALIDKLHDAMQQVCLQQ